MRNGWARTLDPKLIGDPQTWRHFAPRLHVANGSSCAPFPVQPERARHIASRIREEGYIQQAPPDWNLPIAVLADLIRTLAQHGFPTVFAFHYDEVWLLFARLREMIAAALGPDFSMLPSFWAWHVDPTKGGSGWAPHRDSGRQALFPDGTPKALTVWIPLTDATPLNGCMYLVPADRDPTYNTPDEQHLKFQLSDIRALPARAGSVLAWTHGVIHWGAACASAAADRSPEPRISLSCEFQRTDTEPLRTPLLDPASPPAFHVRQHLIGTVMLRYRHMYPLTPALESIAHEMVSSTALALSQRI